MLKTSRFLVLALLFLSLIACAGPGVKPERARGIYHVVKKGETLWSISKAYRVSLQEIAEVNNITNAAAIEAGHAIFIPGAEQVIDRISVSEQKEPPKKQAEAREPPRKPPPPKETDRKKTAKTVRTTVPPLPPKEPDHRKTAKADLSPDPAKQPETVKADHPPGDAEARIHEKADKTPENDRIEFDRKRFIWPVKGSLLSRYGIQPNGLKYNGIRISAKDGTPVQAAASGEVTYSDTLKYYGETIIVRHDENFSTVYTSLKSRGVRTGDHVKQGDRIAAVGKSDSNGQSSLNFEIRQLNKPRNPLFFLP